MKKYLFILFSLAFTQAQWTQVDIPDNQNMVKLISDGNGLYGATSSASILFSLDNGLNWESLPMHPDIFPYGVDLFEKVGDYLFFSQNIGGSTYSYRAYYNGEYWGDWEILPYDETIIYEFVHFDNTIYALLDQGVSVSYDYGTTWGLIEMPEISGYVHLQYLDEQYLYINHGCNLYRYNIETHEWTDITGILDDLGPPEPYSCTSISQIEKFADKLIISMYWYGGVGTLFYSQNDGDSWEIISSFPSMSNSGYVHNNISAMTTQSGTLYAGTATSQDGIFYTQNLIDWTEYSLGLSSYNLSVSALAVTEEQIYKLGGTVNLFQNDLIGVVGDVNGDGQINVIDIVLMVGLILEDSYDAVGDVNEDGLLNVIDVVMLVNWVLNGTGCSDGSSWDYDGDDICDADDLDDDNDGAIDSDDSDDNNEYVCSDIDGDNCDDCSSGTFDPANDGPDMNGNGICDEGESNIDSDGDGVIDDEDYAPYDPYACSDNDGDTCDDCSTGHYDTSDDGYDYDGDGQCDAGDCDDDNDGCQECWDYCP